MLKKSLYCYLFFLMLIYFSCKTSKFMKHPKPELEVLNIETPTSDNKAVTNFLSEYLNLKYTGKDFSKYIYVSIKHQQLYLVINDSTVRKYPVSTSKKGIGNKHNSFKTPSGLHTIKRKIGDGIPVGGIFESRVYNGKKAKILHEKNQNSSEDYVTTRIMWLDGEEPGINKGRNVDSYNRYIYIHGTPEEGKIGRPASHGCIRMKNKDVIELYELVEEGTPILILSN